MQVFGGHGLTLSTEGKRMTLSQYLRRAVLRAVLVTSIPAAWLGSTWVGEALRAVMHNQ